MQTKQVCKPGYGDDSVAFTMKMTIILIIDKPSRYPGGDSQFNTRTTTLPVGNRRMRYEYGD